MQKVMRFLLLILLFPGTIWAAVVEPDAAVRVDVSNTSAAITFLSWDTEGSGRESRNLLREGSAVEIQRDAGGKYVPLVFAEGENSTTSSQTFHSMDEPGLSWSVQHADTGVTWTISNSGAGRLTSTTLRMGFPFDPRVTPTTLIPGGWDEKGEELLLPAIVSAPDFGQMLLSSDGDCRAELTGSRQYKITDIWLNIQCPAEGTSVSVTLLPLVLPSPAPEIDPAMWRLARRGWFNVFQPGSKWRLSDSKVSARTGILSNNVISDPVSFSLWMYADQALWTPELATGISAMDSIRRTLEWWMDEKTSTTGECIGYWSYYNFLDSNPSLIIAAWDYVEATGNQEWLKTRIDDLERLSAFLESRNIDEDGLVEAVQSGNDNTLVEPLRSSCWWDAINCGHKDAYSNILIYRAWRCLADLEKQLGRTAQQEKYNRLADGIRESFYPVLFNPANGWFAWWKSEDGELHDYGSPVVNGMAVEYGLVDAETGKQILSRLRAKMDQVGFSNFKLGVPCQLSPVHRSDYLQPAGLGCPQREDGTDSFGKYMNGGLNSGHVLHFLAAHYVVGDPEPADSILRQMLGHLYRGGFQNGVTDEPPKGIDWADWEGNPQGYEGYLSDGFRFPQALLLRHAKYRDRLYRPLEQ